jgi:hypothetical protein
MTKWMRVAALVLLPMMAACEEEANGPDEVDPGEEVAVIRLALGNQTVDVAQNGSVSGTLDVPRGNSTLSATFHRQSGTPITLPSTGAFTIGVTSSNPGRVSVAQTNPFSVTLNGVQTGTATLAIRLIHGSHDEIGPFNVTVNVLPATDN